MPKRTQPIIIYNHPMRINSTIMKTDYFRMITFTLWVAVISCDEKEKLETEMPIKIETNKSSYSQNESISFLVNNTSDSLAYYYKCSSYEGIPFSIFKLENNAWNCYWSPICDGYRSYCCPSLVQAIPNRDTLKMELDPGTYKLEYSFIVRPSHEYMSYYSNTFKIE
jgi:hypothetical protein